MYLLQGLVSCVSKNTTSGKRETGELATTRRKVDEHKIIKAGKWRMLMNPMRDKNQGKCPRGGEKGRSLWDPWPRLLSRRSPKGVSKQKIRVLSRRVKAMIEKKKQKNKKTKKRDKKTKQKRSIRISIGKFLP